MDRMAMKRWWRLSLTTEFTFRIYIPPTARVVSAPWPANARRVRKAARA